MKFIIPLLLIVSIIVMGCAQTEPVPTDDATPPVIPEPTLDLPTDTPEEINTTIVDETANDLAAALDDW